MIFKVLAFIQVAYFLGVFLVLLVHDWRERGRRLEAARDARVAHQLRIWGGGVNYE